MKTKIKIILPLLAVMFLAGCDNSSTNQSSSTNSVSGSSTSTNDMINNVPPVVTTNMPATTNR